MKLSNKNVLIIVGPTASGKTDLSIQIALHTGGEIVSADSRQVYRLMDIGTAKPSAEALAKIPHHCINIKDPSEYFSAGEYAMLARDVIHKIQKRNRLPIVVGGSGLYIRALVDGVFTGNYRDVEIRKHLKKRLLSEGNESLYRELIAKDPVAASKIHCNDSRRIIRALEVILITGKPMSIIQKEKTVAADFTPQFYGLNWKRDELYCRIERRVDRMMKSGLIDEVKQLRKMGYKPAYNSLDSVGYKEIFSYLDGLITFEETVELIKKNTRRYTKRQLTWFRRDERIQWIDVSSSVNWESLAERILRDLKDAIA